MDNYNQVLNFVKDYEYKGHHEASLPPGMSVTEIKKQLTDYPLAETEVIDLLLQCEDCKFDNDALLYLRDSAGDQYCLLVILCGHKYWHLIDIFFDWSSITYDLICDVHNNYGKDAATALFYKKIEVEVEAVSN